MPKKTASYKSPVPGLDRADGLTLLYLETRATDHYGRVDAQRMNKQDRDSIAKMEKMGLLSFGRIVYADCNNYGSEWVELTDTGWQAAAELRKARGRQDFKNRPYRRTCDKDA